MEQFNGVSMLPWLVDEDGNIESGIEGLLIHSAVDNVCISLEDAKYIVLACNAFPKLFSALKATEELLAFHEGSYKQDKPDSCPYVAINAQADGGDFQTLLAKVREALVTVN